MSKPITSRVKRSPLFKYSPLKQDTPATAGGSEAGGTTTKNVDSEVTEKKRNYAKDEQVCSAEYKAKTGKGGPGSKECQEWKDTSPEQKKKAETTTTETCPPGSTGTPPNCTVETKEDDLDYEGTLQTAKHGRVLEPWQINRLKRGTRKATNERDQAARRLDRNKGVTFKDGKYVLNDNATAKERRKFNKQNDRFIDADNTAKNQTLARESGRLAGEEYYKGDRDRGLGEQSDPEQKAQFKRDAIKKNKAEKAAAAAAAKAAKDKAELDAAKKVADEENEQKEADANGVTTGQSNSEVGIDVAPISLGGGFGSGLDLYKQSSYTPLVMTKKGYSMKAKSPATKKLQGAQNTLPPHLQAAIKGAPGKMKSALKKGYFKNK